MGVMVRMVSTTIKMCLPFLTFFSMWILLFNSLYMGLNLEVDDEEYPKVNFFTRVLLLTYRNSIGDIQVPDYKTWLNAYDESVGGSESKQLQILVLVWSVWFFNQLICLIILLNFLIAVISQGYDIVVAESNIDKYMTRGDFNLEYNILMSALGRLQRFQVLILQMERENE